MWVCWVDLDTPMVVSATCGWCRNVPMCLLNLQKFGAWALTEAEVLTSPLPHVISQLGPVLGTDTLPTGVSTPSKWSINVPMCQEPPKNLVHGALMEVEILTSPLPHVFAHLGPVWCTGAQPVNVSTPPRWSRNVSLCLLKKLVHGP